MSDEPPKLYPSDGGFASIVPEFIVLDFEKSRTFWCEVLGFQVVFERAGYAYLRQGNVEVMIAGATGFWETGPLERPLGRGINFQMFLGSPDAIAARITASGWPLHSEVHEAWHCSGGVNRGYRQLLVQDPDGYLLRFAEKLGSYPMPDREKESAKI
jgi:catechol 2,3-dioxygenase-like lactoylglutathione lyase family enzyme